ncbi:MAG: LysR substrate-binding domain-containing protein, partial [Hyphomicrobiales bacterium]
AKHMESEVLEAERHLIGQDVYPSGTVRITTLDSLLVGVLSPIFSDFQRAHSEISLEVVVTNELHNLTRREADIAIRPSNAPPENLIGRKLARLHYAVYGHTELALVSNSLYDHPWLGPDDTMHYPDL